MADEIDLAQEAEALHHQAALAAARSHRAETPLVIDGVRVCTECEEPIALERLASVPAAVRCWNCQDALERRRGGR